MKAKELYALRREGERKFDKISDLRGFLTDLLGEKLILPMVVGYMQFGEKEWEVANLQPLTTSTELTVRNYLEGLKNIEQSNRQDLFSGRIFYDGVETLHYSNWDSRIISAEVRQIGERSPIQTFDLDLHFSHIGHSGSSDEKTGYEAAAKVTETELEKACKRFSGPNTHYARILS